MKIKTISSDGVITIEMKKKYTQDRIAGEEAAVINIFARKEITIKELSMAIFTCLDGALGFKINPEYKKIVIYFQKANSTEGRKFTIENDIDNIIFNLADEITL